MMRVLHMLDQRSDQACGCTLGLLAESRGRLGHVDEQVMLLAGGDLASVAESAGVGPVRRVGAPLGCAALAWSAARRAAADMAQGKPFDVIHCWSLGSLVLAAMLFRTTPRILTVTSAPSRRACRLLRALCTEAAGRTLLLPTSATIRRELLASGIDQRLVHTLRPGLTMSRIDRNVRDSLRAEWGIEPDTDTRVVALLSDPPEAGDALEAAMILTAAMEGEALHGRDIRLLVTPRQHHIRRAASLMRQRGWHDLVLIDRRAALPWRVLPGCDLALTIGACAGGMSLLWAMAAGVPIVGEATYAISEIIEDRHSALLVKPGHRSAAAHRVRQIITDPQLAWKLRDTARHEAYSYFSRQRYCQSLVGVYQQVAAGDDITIPDLEPTGGLRFTGRA